MWNRTGRYLAQQRHARHLTPQQLAALLGYRNITKGGRRILALERDGATVEDLLERVVEALGLDLAFVQALVEDDRRAYREAWEQWASEPIAFELRFRPFPSLWCGASLPAGLTEDAAIAYAQERAITTGWTHLLLTSRKVQVWCYPDRSTGRGTAEVGDVAGPYSATGSGRGFVFG